MSKKKKPTIPTLELIRRLRLMYSAGGMLTKDRLEAILQAADRLEELDERVAIMSSEGSFERLHLSIFNEANDDVLFEGGEDK